MRHEDNRVSYTSIFSSVLIKTALCAVAPKIAIKTLSSLGAQNMINSFDEQPTKPLFVVCILNVIGSDVTDLFERIYEDSNELYSKYIGDDIDILKSNTGEDFQDGSLVSFGGHNETFISSE